MGLRWSTPRVLGVSYNTGGRGGCGAALGGVMLFGLIFEIIRALVHIWWVIVPLLVLLAVAIIWSRRQQARNQWATPDRPQSSVSNRR